MKKYEVVNDITTETYSIPKDSGVWTQEMLENAGMTVIEIDEHVTLCNLFEITFANPVPGGPQ